MAWNGGVSLAIWMGGAAVELDAARRAHLGRQQEAGNERSLYHALTQAFDRELVIDILAGASAGGINGALLGAVITKRRELRPSFLRQRWLDLGDLSELLRPLNEAKPVSLMRGDYFRDQIRRAFQAVTGEGDDKEWLEQTKPSQDALVAGEVVLDIQATNVAGTQRGFSDEWHQTLYAREYRAPIRFRQPDDYSSDALTAAARASASFPVAFEPSPLINKSARLGGFPGVKRWAIDGGLLENAPIRPAIDLIPTRQAERPVTRFVCYVNAAPTIASEDDDDPVQPGLRKILGDVINLPREGRFIDQLSAIEDATQRTTAVKAVATGLLALPQAHLHATAEALLDAYRKPRTLASLRELMIASADAGKVAAAVAAVDDALGKDKLLPWIPDSLDPPTQASEWRWGLRPAQRVVLLQLDLLRVAADHDNPAMRAERAAKLLEFRRPLNKLLSRLEDARQRFSSSPAIREAAVQLGAAAQAGSAEFDERLEELGSLLVGFRCEAFDAVSRGAEALHKALAEGALPVEAAGMTTLFGETTGEFSAAHLKAFLGRALCIEVVRRAFAPDHDLEPTQELHFVQLTPLAPVRFFATRPLRNEGPNSGREKLTGLESGALLGLLSPRLARQRLHVGTAGRGDPDRRPDGQLDAQRPADAQRRDADERTAREPRSRARACRQQSGGEGAPAVGQGGARRREARVAPATRPGQPLPEERKALDEQACGRAPGRRRESRRGKRPGPRRRNGAPRSVAEGIRRRPQGSKARRVLHPRRLRPRRALRDPAPGAAAARRGDRAGREARLLHEAAPP